jgi:hypothetical protein
MHNGCSKQLEHGAKLAAAQRHKCAHKYGKQAVDGGA